jgi:hypothetical protein
MISQVEHYRNEARKLSDKTLKTREQEAALVRARAIEEARRLAEKAYRARPVSVRPGS